MKVSVFGSLYAHRARFLRTGLYGRNKIIKSKYSLHFHMLTFMSFIFVMGRNYLLKIHYINFIRKQLKKIPLANVIRPAVERITFKCETGQQYNVNLVKNLLRTLKL